MTYEQARQVAERINAAYRDSTKSPVTAIVGTTTLGGYGVIVRYRVGGGYGKTIPACDAYTSIGDAYNVWPWKCDGHANSDWGGN